MTSISVGVVGCSAIFARSYLPDLAASPHIQLVVVCDADPARVRRMVERHAVLAWYVDAPVSPQARCWLTPTSS